MEIYGLTTKNGGKMHAHFGKKCTTNLWDSWLEVTDMQVVFDLKLALMKKDVSKVIEVRKKYENNILSLSKPYSRVKPDAEKPVADKSAADKSNEIDVGALIRAAQCAAVKDLQKFFSEFRFTPAARFINTMALQPNVKAVREYVTNYAKLVNNSDSDSIAEKVKSPEFKQIAENIIAHPPVNKINNRLVIWYGDAGTGKTTKAVNDNPGADVIPCNANIMPDELMRTFDFNDANGNPVFKPSSLRVAMETGKTIIFDEINLLTFDCLRLLQTLTDSKDTITYNGETINIKPGFKIIGTMNLVVNDQIYNLPEPLVDRCAEIKEFDMTADTLTAYAFG